ncbi:MAG: hypothetical protein KAS17_08830 [Victivallaceae bacterium]|nr:hypothetical protein [Victivallaceae bacterium]
MDQNMIQNGRLEKNEDFFQRKQLLTLNHYGAGIMKKTGLILALLTLGILTFAGEKVDIKFSGKRVNAYIKRKICVVKDNVLSISGDTTAKNNSWRGVVFPLAYKSPAGKKFKFSGEIKLEKINPKARFEVAIRLINAKNKSIKYERFSLSKDQDWGKFTKSFTASAQTVKMQLYVLARYLSDESIGSVKNLSIEQI